MKGIQIFFKYQLLTLFIVAIFAPAVNQTFGIWEFERKDENRVFKDSITIDIASIDSFPKNFRNFYNDNFAFRAPFLKIFHHMKFYYYKVSPNPQKTIIGSDGWYFMAEKEKLIYEGKLDFSKEELEKFYNIWKYRDHYLDSMNITYYWMIAPMKHYIYSEFLPFNIDRSDSVKRVDQLKNYLDKSFPDLIIDPTEELLKNKSSAKLFFRLDNHWNYTAGNIASKMLLSKIKKDFPYKTIDDITEYMWIDSTFSQGIHYKVIGIPTLYDQDIFPETLTERSKAVYGYKFPVVKGFPYPWEYEKRYVNQNCNNDLKVLIIRDSFGSSLIPFIKEPFMECEFIFDAWQYDLNKEIIEKMKPDIVIFQSLETNLKSFID